MVLVDSSVFIEFFRGKDIASFKELLLNNQIALSHYVRLELIQGVRKDERHRLEYVLGGLTMIPPHEKVFEHAEQLLLKLTGVGFTLGTIDLLLASESNLTHSPIFSYDAIFSKLAQKKLIHCFNPSPVRNLRLI